MNQILRLLAAEWFIRLTHFFPHQFNDRALVGMGLNHDFMKNSFPLWAYLNQKLFNPATPLILNPLKFWQSYQLFQLEQCWNFDATQHLEFSWNRELDSEASHVHPIKE